MELRSKRARSCKDRQQHRAPHKQPRAVVKATRKQSIGDRPAKRIRTRKQERTIATRLGDAEGSAEQLKAQQEKILCLQTANEFLSAQLRKLEDSSAPTQGLVARLMALEEAFTTIKSCIKDTNGAFEQLKAQQEEILCLQTANEFLSAQLRELEDSASSTQDLAARLGALEGALGTVESRLSAHDSDESAFWLDRIIGDIETFDIRCSRAESRISVQNERINGHTRELKIFDTQLEQLCNRMLTTETQVASFGDLKDIRSLLTSLAQPQPDVLESRDWRHDTSEKLSSISDALDRSSSAIERLTGNAGSLDATFGNLKATVYGNTERLKMLDKGVLAFLREEWVPSQLQTQSKLEGFDRSVSKTKEEIRQVSDAVIALGDLVCSKLC